MSGGRQSDVQCEDMGVFVVGVGESDFGRRSAAAFIDGEVDEGCRAWWGGGSGRASAGQDLGIDLFRAEYADELFVRGGDAASRGEVSPRGLQPWREQFGEREGRKPWRYQMSSDLF